MAILDELIRVLKKINIYIFCSQKQIITLLDYFAIKHNCNFNILTWHKTNPAPMCKNKYLSDTEYILFFRDPGVNIYGTFETKRQFFITETNKKDKEIFEHPTPKPVPILENLIINSSLENETILDCFSGSGATGEACLKNNRSFIGIELNKKYYEISKQRLEAFTSQGLLF